ncbi:hypothetical protein DHEL01_v202593 [Diaporthe helianthi]|uniref:Transcription factor domain-containing protein n=1 Tax=Diaporthe helianthi TaxID=158607 RepID=A0A2P5I933_DIAHE|nr:hypothetical protein DHEL01_v202593 [Diaporthe helianthi]
MLHASLPPQQEINRICSVGDHFSVLPPETMTTPFLVLEKRGLKTAETLLEPPGSNAHPVLLARYMLCLATFIQSRGTKNLSESDQVIMERLVDIATLRVTKNNDRFIGTIEGLDCLVIESVYHSNMGNLRRGWLATRRAMSVAQLMGLNRTGAQIGMQYERLHVGSLTHYDPRTMWFRIVDHDRCLCLMLNLTQGSLDRSMASDAMLASDTPLGRIERIHCVIASRILDRNESTSYSHDANLTRSLDIELQKAARQLPSKWWLVPDLRRSEDPQALFWDTRRLSAQVLHYNLLNLLHLPYMLRSSSVKREQEYSLITCANASRDILTRFIVLRSFDGTAYNCRTVDFIALIAAMTLLLAHLDSHHLEAQNLLAQQYYSDRAMIEQIKDYMEEFDRAKSDPLSSQIANWLSRLLEIEAETSDDGGLLHATTVSAQEAGALDEVGDSHDAVIVQLPCYGVLKIVRRGINRDVHIEKQRPQGGGPDTAAVPVEATAQPDGECSGGIGSSSAAASDYCSAEHSVQTHSPPCMERDCSSLDNLQQARGLTQFPDMAATNDQWAFQGVDWAFFENFTRHTGLYSTDEVGDTDWTLN